MLRKGSLLLLVVFIFTSVVCFGAPNKVNLTYWDENASPDRTPYLQEMIKKFNDTNPDIQVEYVGLPWSSAKQKIDVAVAANATPDCSGSINWWLADLVGKNAIIPLDSYFNKLPDRKQYMPVQIDGMRKMVPDKKLYQLPCSFNAWLFWYRADWFKEAGLNPPSTWNEFLADIAKLTDKSKGRYGYSIRGASGNTVSIEQLLYGYSGITDYFTKNGKCTINDPLHVEFLKKYVALYKSYTPETDVNNGYPEMVANFDNGVAAMIMHNLGSYGTHVKFLQPDQFAALQYPLGKKGKRPYLIQTSGYIIYKSSKHPKEAFKFISYLGSAPNQSFWNKTIGQLSPRLDVNQESWVTEGQRYQTLAKSFADKNTVMMASPSYLPQYNDIHTMLTPEFQSVLLGKKSVEDFLNEWAAAFEKAKAEYDKTVRK